MSHFFLFQVGKGLFTKVSTGLPLAVLQRKSKIEVYYWITYPVLESISHLHHTEEPNWLNSGNRKYVREESTIRIVSVWSKFINT
jgi:hypothetical protein